MNSKERVIGALEHKPLLLLGEFRTVKLKRINGVSYLLETINYTWLHRIKLSTLILSYLC